MAHHDGRHGDALPSASPWAFERSARLTRFPRALQLLFGLFLGLLFAQTGLAQEGDVVAAANAFQQAQRAELSGDMARAAELYELADRIAPTPEALRNATRSRLAAGQLVAAATHAEALLARYGEDPASTELANEVLRRARPELGRLTVHCDAPCTLIIDGLAGTTSAGANHVAYVKPGSHQVVARFADGTSQALPLVASAGADSELSAQKPALAQAEQPSESAQPSEQTDAPSSSAASETEGRRARLSPVYFWTLAGLTVGVGAVTVWSGMDLLDARDKFKADRTPTRGKFEQGEKKDLRTTLLIAGTAGLAVGTAVLAVFTDFRGDRLAPTVSLTTESAELGLKGRF
jgi:hypothetical protein